MKPTPRKCLLLLLDGLADRAQDALGGLTPLQAAATPNLDRLAATGACGHFHALTPGRALPSEAAHFFMMGYGPDEFPGRGYLEALGEGVRFEPDEVLLLAHLARCDRQDNQLILREKKPRLDEEEAAALFAAVASFEAASGRARLIRSQNSSGILVLSGDLSPRVTDSDPMLKGRPLLEPLPWREAAHDPRVQNTSTLLHDYLTWAHSALAAHPLNDQAEFPVNAVITQRAGQARELPSLQKRWGLRVLSISSAPIYRGIFLALGAEALVVPEEPDPGGDLEAKLRLSWERLDEFDLIHVHSKAPDQAGHRADPLLKKEVIEALDAGLGKVLPELERRELLLVVTGDHATASSGQMVHSGEPSPLLLHGPEVWRDQASGFDEVGCAAGALGLLRGSDLMHTILSGLDRGKLWGLRDHPLDLPFYPAPASPLTLPE